MNYDSSATAQACKTTKDKHHCETMALVTPFAGLQPSAQNSALLHAYLQIHAKIMDLLHAP